jgi:hypothetical protein
MVSFQRSLSSLPFPPLPARFIDAYEPGELRLRRFGTEMADLDLDFNRPAPQVVTQVIGCCAWRADGMKLDETLFGELSVSTRIVCLLLLAGLDGVEKLVAGLTCPVPDCGGQYEVDLTLDEVLAYGQTDADEPLRVDLDTFVLSLRRPTGNDQLAWLNAGFRNVQAARLGILRSLALSELPEDLAELQLVQIEAALDENDPLVCFSLTTPCPACETAAVHEVSLSDLALRVLRGAQSRLVEIVHLLASHYGWSEAAVLEIPAWRRERYLLLIGASGA